MTELTLRVCRVQLESRRLHDRETRLTDSDSFLPFSSAHGPPAAPAVELLTADTR